MCGRGMNGAVLLDYPLLCIGDRLGYEVSLSDLELYKKVTLRLLRHDTVVMQFRVRQKDGVYIAFLYVYKKRRLPF